ncbi:putative ABC transporter ATP-binding protein [uncultured archaeon]|nr:putative ABC transporter ATP-binding protein [uncultured archaeon]
MKPVIELKKVYKTYEMGETTVEALKNVTLQINQGEFVAITGPSGSGKSTLMNIVGCLDTPTSGTVLLDGKDITKLSESQLAQTRGKKIGFVFQQFNLIPTLNAMQNVMLPQEFQDTDSAIAGKKSKQLLDLVGLSDRMTHLPSQLSGGQLQRVAIARALSVDPDIILADEPTGNLDTKTGQFIMQTLKEINKNNGKTIILVTHDLHLARMAKKIIMIKDGQVEKIEVNK